tara:strand:- start:297 stop:554 length:258 start_codon:yes stop_codon:yes gene_type:complete
MAEIKTGDRVKWIRPMTAVPHPEGKTCRKGIVLPVFRDKEFIGEVVSLCGNGKVQVRPEDLTCELPKGIPSYYDQNIDRDKLTLV